MLRIKQDYMKTWESIATSAKNARREAEGYHCQAGHARIGWTVRKSQIMSVSCVSISWTSICPIKIFSRLCRQLPASGSCGLFLLAAS